MTLFGSKDNWAKQYFFVNRRPPKPDIVKSRNWNCGRMWHYISEKTPVGTKCNIAFFSFLFVTKRLILKTLLKTPRMSILVLTMLGWGGCRFTNTFSLYILDFDPGNVKFSNIHVLSHSLASHCHGGLAFWNRSLLTRAGKQATLFSWTPDIFKYARTCIYTLFQGYVSRLLEHLS